MEFKAWAMSTVWENVIYNSDFLAFIWKTIWKQRALLNILSGNKGTNVVNKSSNVVSIFNIVTIIYTGRLKH